MAHLCTADCGSRMLLQSLLIQGVKQMEIKCWASTRNLSDYGIVVQEILISVKFSVGKVYILQNHRKCMIALYQYCNCSLQFTVLNSFLQILKFSFVLFPVYKCLEVGVCWLITVVSFPPGFTSTHKACATSCITKLGIRKQRKLYHD